MTAAMNRVLGFVRLIRPVNCGMMGFAVIVGAALAGNEILLQLHQGLFFGFATGFFLTAATMTINDYYDRKIDAINEPRRPIPSGSVRPSEALAYASVLTAIGFASAALTNWQSLLIASISWAVFVLYTTKGKSTGLLGNLMVSFCITVPFVYGVFTVGKSLLLTTSIFVVIVFLSNTGREITKGIVDIKGDKENNIKTIAVIGGEQKAAIAAATFYFSSILLTPIPWISGLVSFWYLPFVALTDIGLASASIALLLNPSRERARKTKSQSLLWFSIGLLAFVTGTLR